MTTSIAENLATSRKRSSSPREVLTFRSDLRAALAEQMRARTHVAWPSPRYRDDPVRFFREVLGVDPWHKQIEIIQAVRAHKRVAVKSGHKVSKSHTAAGIARGFWCS